METERVARLEEQSKWIVNKVDRIEKKIDIISDRLSLWVGKVLGAAAITGFLSAIAIEFFRR